jgi:uracil-DNA glycosylase family 4
VFEGKQNETSRDLAFNELVSAVSSCRQCPRMLTRRRVLSRANGVAPSRVMFVAEAPGRLGSERTGIPMTGDQTGRNFDALLHAAGWSRSDVFVTNAVLCNPRNVETRNARPTSQEMRNCSHFLQTTIELVDPSFVIALGAVALDALRLLAPHEARLASDVGSPVRWDGRWLVPLYHPSPRAQLHRPFERQLADFVRLGEMVRHAGGDGDTIHKLVQPADGAAYD